MRQTGRGPNPDLQKILSIWAAVLLIILVTACFSGIQVYYWQRSAAAKERANLIRQNQRLAAEVARLKAALNHSGQGSNPGVQPRAISVKHPVAQGSSGKSPTIPSNLAARERMVLEALRRQDMTALARLVDPEKGLRFSPYSYVNIQQDLVFDVDQLPGLLRAKTNYLWGYYDGTGLPIRLKSAEYFKSFVYERDYLLDGAEPSSGAVLKNSVTAGNVFEVYPKAVVVEYRDAESKTSMNWHYLKLVFEARDKTWFLVGLVHDQWTI